MQHVIHPPRAEINMHVSGQTLVPQEHFKECEKEAKMKPFAKAALAAGYTEKLDPTLEAKSEAQRWLKNAVSSLAEQVECFEVCLPANVYTIS
jgi:CCR4-NOT transcriptional regulation complex NOT5 subunit